MDREELRQRQATLLRMMENYVERQNPDPRTARSEPAVYKSAEESPGGITAGSAGTPASLAGGSLHALSTTYRPTLTSGDL